MLLLVYSSTIVCCSLLSLVLSGSAAPGSLSTIVCFSLLISCTLWQCCSWLTPPNSVCCSPYPFTFWQSCSWFTPLPLFAALSSALYSLAVLLLVHSLLLFDALSSALALSGSAAPGLLYHCLLPSPHSLYSLKYRICSMKCHRACAACRVAIVRSDNGLFLICACMYRGGSSFQGRGVEVVWGHDTFLPASGTLLSPSGLKWYMRS